ncbi:lysylphosphatidylglycerol synthase transmembrane domain-containing protein [Dactylosporangium sp. AC04546]|uniref:lysylphosphatidylglycerol synthase transmembrane domain-containing protein n=1 Tax=Dactylosporangium sp. AC04546 TaxID=2862460 RepID=UPI001EDEE60E|nr:lysylphosphatidylglycerol synthase transmembrane domain-containing protein [Dactylosporangium sp. AC04546]WVK80506.1 lysylphosphatidylglycerol synthase transmembrane domain-containing protein [Dactylosporangium sp. AC04546]
MTRLLAIAVVVVGLTVVGLRGRLPALSDVVDALVDADYGWVLLAVSLQLASIGAFVLQQRHLLHSLGVHLRRGRAFAIILASTAVGIAVPAGAAVSTAFTIREYRRVGATREIAAACAIVSGLASIGGMALLYVGGSLAFLAGSPAGLNWRPLLIVIGLAALTLVAMVIGRRHLRRPSPGERESGGSRAARYVRAVLRSAREAWRAGAEISARDWAAALAYATIKWFADLMCLVAAVRALDQPAGVTALAGIYLSVQIVRQVPLTPGGIGVIDAALVAGLTATGASTTSATAAVLIYRLLSCWLIVPAGGVAALALRRAPNTSI